ncbi:MAG: response regulator [Deltaproteobacteria bacterium]|nr:response regulator [Deltaproteobacteria bacterium]
MNSATSQQHIMIIDDEPGVLTALKLMLGAMGANAEIFERGSDAIEALKAGSDFNLILCDLRMPEMDGFEVLAAIREFLPDIPFYLISGHADDDDIAHANSLGMTGFLAKPFDPEEIRIILAS